MRAPERPEPPPWRPPPQPQRRHRSTTIAWVALTAVLLAVGITSGTLTFLALRGDDDEPASPGSQQGITVAYGERLEVPGVIGVRVLGVERIRRLPPLHEGGRPVSADGIWVVVKVAVTNRTRGDQTVSARVLEIEDDRLIYTGGGGTASSQELFLRSALHGRTLRPGQTATGALAYDVPRRAKPKWLRVPHSWAVLDVDDPKVEVSYAELEP
jgi:hypothetical protein